MRKLWNLKEKKIRYSVSLILSVCMVWIVFLFCGRECFAAGQGQDRESGFDAAWQEQDREDILNETEQAIKALLLWQCEKYSVADTRQLLDDIYAADAANGVTLSYVTGICGDPCAESPYDFSEYGQALHEALQDTSGMSVATIQKAAIVLEQLGMSASLPQEQMDDLYRTIGQEGIMTDIYGLMLLSGYPPTRDAILQQAIASLLDRQLADGGFAVSGTDADVDVTAMALRALAPWYRQTEGTGKQGTVEIPEEYLAAVRKSVERGLDFLSGVQLEDGSFESYGSRTSESTSQVILALVALGLDPLSADDFIKNGNSLYDDLMRYQCSDGGFAHTPGAASNDMATSQAFCALMAIRKNLGGANPGVYEVSVGSTQDTKTAEPGGIWDYRVILSAGMVIAALLYLFICIRGKHMTKNRLISLICILAAGISVVWLIRIQTREEYRNSGISDEQTENITVAIQIRCDTVAGRKAYIPQDGVILARTQMEVPDGTSVFEVLQEACRLYDIQLEYEGGSGSGSFVYVEGINYLYEYDFGDLSGWMYQVDGEFPSVGSGEYRPADQQEIVWVYTQELGKDVGADEIH